MTNQVKEDTASLELREAAEAIRAIHDTIIRDLQLVDPLKEIRETLKAIQFVDPLKDVREAIQFFQLHNPLKEVQQAIATFDNSLTPFRFFKNILEPSSLQIR